MTRFSGKSFKSILDLNNGAGLGFDLLRLGLAVLVLVCHGSHVTGHSGTSASIVNWFHHLGFGAASPASAHPAPSVALANPVPSAADGIADPTPMTGLNSISGPFIRALVPMFFTLSGFLVAGSAFRTKGLLRFLGLRTLRILPALLVEVTLSAIILGAAFTTLPLREYYSSPIFFSYFLNVFGIVHFVLPGVFEHAQTSSVNSNLWTIPFELECYMLMSVLIVLGLLRKRMLLTVLFVAATAGLLIASIFYGYMAKVDVYPGRALVYCFSVGVMFYIWRDKIIFHPLIFVASLAISYGLLWYSNTTFIAPFFLCYATVFIGLMPLPKFALLTSGDYSYGIYLYGFPITQALVAVLGRDTIPFPLMMLLAVATTSLVAAFSWHGVEKHWLKLKRFLSKPSARIMDEMHPDTAQPDQPMAISTPAAPAG